jgi:hypothetical protein
MPPILVLAGLLMQTAGAPDPQAAKPPAELVVFVAMPVYHPDGAVTAETVALPANGAALVHVFARRSVCDPAIGGAAEPAEAGYGWRIASTVVSRSERDIVISIDWRRLWDGGRKIQNGPGSTVQLTLHPGDRIPLDHITNSAPRADCRAVGLGLEVRLVQSAVQRPVTRQLLPLGATPGGAQAVDADLWLIHTTPSGVQRVVHQTARIPAVGGKFAFAPTEVTTSRGQLSVELTGVIDRYRTPTGGEFILLSMTRIVRGEGLPASGVPGSTGTAFPLPDPTQVLSFEMPGGAAGGRTLALQGGGAGGEVRTRSGGGTGVATPPPDPARAGGTGAGGAQAGAGGGGAGGVRESLSRVSALLEGHVFSLRMRVTPVPAG